MSHAPPPLLSLLLVILLLILSPPLTLSRKSTPSLNSWPQTKSSIASTASDLFSITDVPTAMHAQALFEEAMVAIQEQEFEHAERILVTALQLSPDDEPCRCKRNTGTKSQALTHQLRPPYPLQCAAAAPAQPRREIH